MEVFCEIIVKNIGLYDIIKDIENKKGGLTAFIIVQIYTFGFHRQQDIYMRIKDMIITLKMPKKYDFLIQLAVIILIIFGTMMIVSTNVGKTTEDPYIIPKVIIKQMVYIIASYILMTFFANNFTMRRAQRFILPLGFVVIASLFATQFFEGVLGSKAWIRIPIPGLGEMTIQPSEFAKVFMVVLMAAFVELNAWKKKLTLWQIVRIPVLFFLVIAIEILFQKDLGTLAVLSMLCAVCYFIPTHPSLRKTQRILCILMILGVLSLTFIMSDSVINFLNKIEPLQHVAVRIENAINPFLDPHGNGYQLINGLYGIARSGITGVGLGNSIQKYGYLTQSDNDFILSIIVEELGIFGLGIVVVMYFIILQRLFYYAFHTKSEGYKIILVGTAMYIFIHFTLNVGGISGLIPLTGVPLLFISSGGSSLMAIMTAIGISQAVIARIRRQGSISSAIPKK